MNSLPPLLVMSFVLTNYGLTGQGFIAWISSFAVIFRFVDLGLQYWFIGDSLKQTLRNPSYIGEYFGTLVVSIILIILVGGALSALIFSMLSQTDKWVTLIPIYPVNILFIAVYGSILLQAVTSTLATVTRCLLTQNHAYWAEISVGILLSTLYVGQILANPGSIYTVLILPSQGLGLSVVYLILLRQNFFEMKFPSLKTFYSTIQNSLKFAIMTFFNQSFDMVLRNGIHHISGLQVLGIIDVTQKIFSFFRAWLAGMIFNDIQDLTKNSFGNDTKLSTVLTSRMFKISKIALPLFVALSSIAWVAAQYTVPYSAYIGIIVIMLFGVNIASIITADYYNLAFSKNKTLYNNLSALITVVLTLISAFIVSNVEIFLVIGWSSLILGNITCAIFNFRYLNRE